MNSDQEIAAAKAALSNAHAASDQHHAWAQSNHLVAEAGGSAVETPQTPDDVAVEWSGDR
jgi:hypothetical protein